MAEHQRKLRDAFHAVCWKLTPQKIRARRLQQVFETVRKVPWAKDMLDQALAAGLSIGFDDELVKTDTGGIYRSSGLFPADPGRIVLNPRQASQSFLMAVTLVHELRHYRQRKTLIDHDPLLLHRRHANPQIDHFYTRMIEADARAVEDLFVQDLLYSGEEKLCRTPDQTAQKLRDVFLVSLKNRQDMKHYDVTTARRVTMLHRQRKDISDWLQTQGAPKISAFRAVLTMNGIAGSVEYMEGLTDRQLYATVMRHACPVSRKQTGLVKQFLAAAHKRWPDTAGRMIKESGRPTRSQSSRRHG